MSSEGPAAGGAPGSGPDRDPVAHPPTGSPEWFHQRWQGTGRGGDAGPGTVRSGRSGRSGHSGHSAASHDYTLPELPESVDIFDTVLRDGSQQEGLSLTVDDKLRVAEQLDHLGVAFIEGGWPGANPKDDEFFQRARTELRLGTSTLVAFGSTRRAGAAADHDDQLRRLLEAGTSAVCMVAKSWDRHVTDALRTSLDEAVAMVADSVDFLVRHDVRVFLDAEHFFDGYRLNPQFALRVLQAAEEYGASTLVLCDTNGGTLPDVVERVVADVVRRAESQVGIHCHNDAGCAVANSLAAVRAGATQLQGCINGYGERSGNADLAAAIPNLTLKLNIRTIPAERLELLTPVAHHIAELVNVAQSPQQPYVGSSVFAHKGGLHASAVARRRDLYEHVSPDQVGNGTRVVVSEMAGRSTLAMKAAEIGLELDSEVLGQVLDQLKRLEHEGYHFEVADGSLELLLRRAAGWEPDYFAVESYRVITDHLLRRGPGELAAAGAAGAAGADGADGADGAASTEATVKVHIGSDRVVATAEGNGPVNALDAALRQAIGAYFPELGSVHLTDFRVRVLDTRHGTGAVTRVLVDTADDSGTWTTIGVSENIIEASWQALYESIVFALLRHEEPSAVR